MRYSVKYTDRHGFTFYYNFVDCTWRKILANKKITRAFYTTDYNKAVTVSCLMYQYSATITMHPKTMRASKTHA